MLDDGFFYKELLVIVQSFIKLIKIGIRCDLFLGNTLSTEFVYCLCKYRFLALAELTECLGIAFFKVYKLSSDIFGEILIKQRLVVKNREIGSVVELFRNKQVIVHIHKGATVFALYICKAENTVIKIAHRVSENAPYHIEEHHKAVFTRFLMDGVYMHEHSFEATRKKSAEEGFYLCHYSQKPFQSRNILDSIFDMIFFIGVVTISFSLAVRPNIHTGTIKETRYIAPQSSISR